MSFPGTPYYLRRDRTDALVRIKDPAKAKELLKQAGYKGEKIVLETNSNYPYMRSTMLCAEQLKAAGINADVQVIDWMNNSIDCSAAPATGTSPPPASARRHRSAAAIETARSTRSRISTKDPRRSIAAFDSLSNRRDARRGRPPARHREERCPRPAPIWSRSPIPARCAAIQQHAGQQRIRRLASRFWDRG